MFVKLIVRVINIYQALSSKFPQRCRFYPSCSQYSKEAIVKYGLFKGIVFAVIRVLKCHPFHPGGYDPV